MPRRGAGGLCREPFVGVIVREPACRRVDECGRRVGAVALGHAVDEPRVECARLHRGLGDQAPQEGDVRVDAEHDGVGERTVEPFERLCPIGTERDDLGDHRVVVRRDLLALADARVDAHALALGCSPGDDRPRRREEPAVRRLGVDARLDGMPVEPHLLLRERERLACGDAELLLDEVDARHELGDRMLDLQSGVHLDEEELVGRGIGDEELDRARAEVADAAGGVAGREADALAGLLVEQRRGRLFDDLLVPPLQRALALAEVHDVARRIGEDLHLDVARTLDEALEQQRVVAERGARDPACRGERCGQLVGRADDLHALAAAARRGLDEQRESHGIGRGDEPGVVERRVGDAGHDRHAGCRDVQLGPDLVAHDVEGLIARADEDDAGLAAGAGEARVLGEEPVAGVHGLRAGRQGGLDDAGGVEVALGGGRRADVHGLVGEAHVRGIGVGVGVHGDRVDAEASQRADHPHRDLAAVGDEHPREGALIAVAAPGRALGIGGARERDHSRLSAARAPYS